MNESTSAAISADLPLERLVHQRLLADGECAVLTRVLLQCAHRETDMERKAEVLGEVVILHRPTALTLAASYRGPRWDLAALEQAACSALINAVCRYDPTTGEDFLTYALPIIRDVVWNGGDRGGAPASRSARDQGHVVPLPRREPPHLVRDELDEAGPDTETATRGEQAQAPAAVEPSAAAQEVARMPASAVPALPRL